MVITIIDITEIENTNLKLNSLSAEYRVLVEKTNTALMLWDAETGLIIHCNERYANLRGHSAQPMIGQNRWDFFSDNEQREKLRQALSEIEPDGVGSVVLDRVDPDGQILKTNVSIHAISSDGINIQEYQSMGQDFTNEMIYRKALEDLFSIISNDEIKPESRIDDAVRILLQAT